MTMLQTEYEFTLPLGYVDADGELHRDGTMRLATAADEILPLKDPRVRANEAYLIVILLSRVVERLGSLSTVSPKIIVGLFAADLVYLQDLYNRSNRIDWKDDGSSPSIERSAGGELVAAGGS